jgi:hypothetical protein
MSMLRIIGAWEQFQNTLTLSQHLQCHDKVPESLRNWPAFEHKPKAKYEAPYNFELGGSKVS